MRFTYSVRLMKRTDLYFNRQYEMTSLNFIEKSNEITSYTKFECSSRIFKLQGVFRFKSFGESKPIKILPSYRDIFKNSEL